MQSSSQTLPTDWQTLALPLILIVTGIVLVGGDLAGLLSLDRITNLWPLSLITIGFGELASLDRG